MRLLDAADVREGTGEWYRGWEGDSRECSVRVVLEDACDPDQGGELIPGSDPGVYTTLPFGITAELHRTVRCMRDDDEKWLQQALESVQEYVLGRALVSQPVAGTESWIGDPAATEVAAPADATGLVAAVAEARALWYAKAVNPDVTPPGHPILHVAPEVAPQLVVDGVLKFNETAVYSVWGDPVVINAGYSLEGNPQVFFTGALEVYLSSVDTSGLLVASRTNKAQLLVSQIAVIDTDPCAIVRVGAMAAGTGQVETISPGDNIGISGAGTLEEILAALNGGGYVADPTTAWDPDTEYASVNETLVYWTGTAWDEKPIL